MLRKLSLNCLTAGLLYLLVAGCTGLAAPNGAPHAAFGPERRCARPPMPAAPFMRFKTASVLPGECREPVPKVGNGRVTLAVTYDNNGYDERLQTAWGFACLVTTATSTVLFDTGGDGSILLKNMATLGLDPLQVDAVVLPHIHADHTGGLAALLEAGARPVVYVPAAFPVSFKNSARMFTRLVEVTGPIEILPGIHCSGEVGTSVIEQALAVETGDGLVVATGCAHPGIVEMVRRSQQRIGGPVAWVVGGFHLGGASKSQIDSIIDELRRLGVQRVALCHCTGDQARTMFGRAFGPAYAPAGAGWRISI